MRTDRATETAQADRPTRLSGKVQVARVKAASASTLAAVIVVVAAVLLIGAGIFALGTSEGDVVEYAVDDARAFYIAEGGLERVRSWLGEQEQADPSFDPVGTTFENQPLGGGLYTARVDSNVTGGNWPEAYRVVSTGEIDGVVRQVKGTIVAVAFSHYQWYAERGGWKWFKTGERFEGPVHTNKDLQIDGDPWFGGRVTASGGYTEKQGSNPTFVVGYELHVPEVPLPDMDYVRSTLRAQALAPGGLYAGPLGNKTYYVLEMGTPSHGFMTYTGYNETGGVIAAPVVADLATLSGAVWFEETIRISGVVDGALTIGTEGFVEITDDLIYYDSTPGSGPDPDCDDVLGLVAAFDLVLSNTVPNQTDCEVHAVMMGLEKALVAEDHESNPPRGTFTLYGGVMVDQGIHIALYAGDELLTGYVRDYHYDARMLTIPPPFFPLTGEYYVLSWEEVVPPVLS